WRVLPRGRSLDDLSNLITLIGNVSLSRGADDKWVWSFHASGVLNVKTLASRIQDKVLIDSNLGSIMYGILGSLGRCKLFGVKSRVGGGLIQAHLWPLLLCEMWLLSLFLPGGFFACDKNRGYFPVNSETVTALDFKEMFSEVGHLECLGC
ncbi:hypothetical protein Tco_0931540, partial [Tanacetum coccineum]